MQLVHHDIRAEDPSETEPILSQPNVAERSEESSSSIEITVGVESSVAAERLSVPEIDESISLVRADQSQCRICLDAEGPYWLFSRSISKTWTPIIGKSSLHFFDPNGHLNIPLTDSSINIAGDDLIAPCHCKGTQKYVHRSCLDNWRSTKEGFAFAHCTECRAKFILRANVPPDRWWLRLKFQFLVARDHAIIFIIVQLVVAFLGVLVYKFYGEELREMFGYEEHPYGFYTMAVLAIVLVGLLYGFFIAIICGQRINERHHHVLAKQELTKEYVVEDREANKDMSELDPSHVTELRMLGLY